MPSDGFLGVLVLMSWRIRILLSLWESWTRTASSKWSTEVILDSLPTFLLGGKSLVLLLCLSVFTHFLSWCTDIFLFSSFSTFGWSCLHHLVHRYNSLIVLMQASNLPLQEILLLILHNKMITQRIDIRFKRFVLFGDLPVERRHVVHISSHSWNFAIPEVHLVPLMWIVHVGLVQSFAEFFELAVLWAQHVFKLLNFCRKGCFICVKSRS